MPTREEALAALQASRAATQANVNRFLGREPPAPPPAPAPQMIEVPEPVIGRIGGEVFWTNNTGAATFGAHLIRNTWTDVGVPVTPPPPTTPPPDETKSIVFEGLDLDVPIWATHITQDKNGTIKAWENDPMDWRMADSYVAAYAGQRQKTVMKPEEYPRLKVEIA